MTVERLLPRTALALLAALAGCETFETGYFQGKVNQVTQTQVNRRYGPPHHTAHPSPDREVWTYFDRGSGTSGYAGSGRPHVCREYRLGFDPEGILRDWELASCAR